MKQLISLLLVLALSPWGYGSWFWPFSSDDEAPPRVSELLEPASIMIDEAYDLAADGKTSEAVEKFRSALRELDRVEMENPDRVQEPEFNTLKNKRATVTAAIDSLLLNEVQTNAKPIAVTDTTELQQKYDQRLGSSLAAENQVAGDANSEKASRPTVDGVVAYLRKRDYASADRAVRELLVAKPNDAVALNLRAAVEIAMNRTKNAETILDQAIMHNPRSYYAYYNMARLKLRTKVNEEAARRYY